MPGHPTRHFIRFFCDSWVPTKFFFFLFLTWRYHEVTLAELWIFYVVNKGSIRKIRPPICLTTKFIRCHSRFSFFINKDGMKTVYSESLNPIKFNSFATSLTPVPLVSYQILQYKKKSINFNLIGKLHLMNKRNIQIGSRYRMHQFTDYSKLTIKQCRG